MSEDKEKCMMPKSIYNILLIIFLVFSIALPTQAAQSKKKVKRSVATKTVKSSKKSSRVLKSSRSSKKPSRVLKSPKTSKLAANYPMTGQVVPAMQGFDRSFIQFLGKWQMPGASVAVMKHGKLVFARGYGYADERHKHPVQPFSLFLGQIGFVSALRNLPDS